MERGLSEPRPPVLSGGRLERYTPALRASCRSTALVRILILATCLLVACRPSAGAEPTPAPTAPPPPTAPAPPAPPTVPAAAPPADGPRAKRHRGAPTAESGWGIARTGQPGRGGQPGRCRQPPC